MAEIETGFFAKEHAYHNLGTFIPEAVPSAEALKLSGLDWKVELREKYLSGEIVEMDGEDVVLAGQKVPNDFSVVRATDNKILGRSVGRVYRPLQNADAFAFADTLVDEGEITFETAGALKGGQLVWMLARVGDEPYKVKGVDEIYPYLLFSNSHNGQSSFRVFPTTIRVVCTNSLVLAFREGRGQGISIQHSGDMDNKLTAAKYVLDSAQKSFGDFITDADLLADTPVSDNNVLQFLEAILPYHKQKKKSKRIKSYHDDIIMKFYTGSADVKHYESSKGTAWGLLNAVTAFTNHDKQPGLSADEMKDSNRVADAKVEALWFGSSGSLNMKAYTLLKDFAKGTPLPEFPSDIAEESVV